MLRGALFVLGLILTVEGFRRRGGWSVVAVMLGGGLLFGSLDSIIDARIERAHRAPTAEAAHGG
jgi:hypothetical protein